MRSSLPLAVALALLLGAAAAMPAGVQAGQGPQDCSELGPGAVRNQDGECYCPAGARVVGGECVSDACISEGPDGAPQVCGGHLAGRCISTGCACFGGHTLVDGVCINDDCMTDGLVCSGGGLCVDSLTYRTEDVHSVLGGCVCRELYRGDLCETCSPDAVRIGGKCVPYHCAIRHPQEPLSECGGHGSCELAGPGVWRLPAEQMARMAAWAADDASPELTAPGLPPWVPPSGDDGAGDGGDGGSEGGGSDERGGEGTDSGDLGGSGALADGIYRFYACVCDTESERVGASCWPKSCLSRKLYSPPGTHRVATVVCNGVGVCLDGSCLCDLGYQGYKCQDCSQGFDLVIEPWSGEEKCLPRSCISQAGGECSGNGVCTFRDDLYERRAAWEQQREAGLVSGDFGEHNPEAQAALDYLEANRVRFACVCSPQYVLRRGACVSVSEINSRSRGTVIAAAASCAALALAALLGVAAWLVARAVCCKRAAGEADAPLRGHVEIDSYVMSANEKRWYRHFRTELDSRPSVPLSPGGSSGPERPPGAPRVSRSPGSRAVRPPAGPARPAGSSASSLGGDGGDAGDPGGAGGSAGAPGDSDTAENADDSGNSESAGYSECPGRLGGRADLLAAGSQAR